MASSANPSSFPLALCFTFSFRPSGNFLSPVFFHEFSSFSRLHSFFCFRSNLILLCTRLFLDVVLLSFFSSPTKPNAKLLLIERHLFSVLEGSIDWLRDGSPQPLLVCPIFPSTAFLWQLQTHSCVFLGGIVWFHRVGCANATRMILPKCAVSLKRSTAVAASWMVLKRANPKTPDRPDICEGI